MEDQTCSRELQLLPRNIPTAPPRWPTALPTKKNPTTDNPSLDLKLSIGPGLLKSPPPSNGEPKSANNIQALRWHASEQIRIASVENAYAEQVKELTKREMELAEQEFARARMVWERAREEVEKAERMKEMATRKAVGSSGAEITCRTCRQRFRA